MDKPAGMFDREFEWAELVCDRYVLVVPKGSPLAARTRAPTLREIAGLPLVGFRDPRSDHRLAMQLHASGIHPRFAFRSDYNHGAWFVAPGVVGYALGSAPKRDDVGFLKWKALTSGADVAASRVVKANIEGMARWAARR